MPRGRQRSHLPMPSRISNQTVGENSGGTGQLAAIYPDPPSATERYHRRVTTMAQSDIRMLTDCTWLHSRTIARSNWVGPSTGGLYCERVAQGTGGILESIQIKTIKSSMDHCIIDSPNDDGLGYVGTPK